MTELFLDLRHFEARDALLDDECGNRLFRILDRAPFPENEQQILTSPLVINSLPPSTMISSPSGVNRIFMAVASEPATASVMASDASAPSATRGNNRFFCCSVPKSISGFMP